MPCKFFILNIKRKKNFLNKSATAKSSDIPDRRVAVPESLPRNVTNIYQEFEYYKEIF